MSTDLLSKWLSHYDPLNRGFTPAGIANAVCATNGFFFPRMKGGHHLRRKIGAAPGASDPIVGSAGHDATTIRTFPWITHEPSTEYTYRLSPIGGGGVENLTDSTTTLVAFDSSGRLLGPRPNPPADLRLTPLSAGRFCLQWTYNSDNEQTAPAEFRLYHDAGTGTIDFTNAAARIPYRPGRFHYEYISPAFPHGQRIRWAVRAASPTGAESQNGPPAAGWAISSPPAANPAVIISRADAESRV